MIGKKFRARVTQDGTICAGNSTFALAISVEATLLLEKVSTYGLLPRLWLLIPINKEHKSILGGGGGAGRLLVGLSRFRATFCGLVATSSSFCFSGQFLTKTMIGLEHISNAKKSTISQKTSWVLINLKVKFKREKMSIIISNGIARQKQRAHIRQPTAWPVQSRMCTDISPRQWLLRTAVSPSSA